jgi:hypothetical protein
MKNKEQIKLLLKKVRKWGEAIQEDVPYSDERLTNLCGLCSARLYDELIKIGEKPEFVSNWQHCYILLHNHILDVTATQFRVNPKRYYPYKTVIRKRDDKYVWWKYENVGKNIYTQEFYKNSSIYQQYGQLPLE